MTGMTGFAWLICAVSVVLIWTALPAAALDLRVSIEDGDPLDRIRIVNTGNCTVAPGLVTINMANSEGRIVIDTEAGGPGTRDPFPITVENGPARLEPVADGDMSLGLRMGGLAPGGGITISFDGDSQTAFWENRRVVFRPEDLTGTRVRYVTLGETVSTVFTGAGSVTLDLPDTACQDDAAPDQVPQV